MLGLHTIMGALRSMFAGTPDAMHESRPAASQDQETPRPGSPRPATPVAAPKPMSTRATGNPADESDLSDLITAPYGPPTSRGYDPYPLIVLPGPQTAEEPETEMAGTSAAAESAGRRPPLWKPMNPLGEAAEDPSSGMYPRGTEPFTVSTLEDLKRDGWVYHNVCRYIQTLIPLRPPGCSYPCATSLPPTLHTLSLPHPRATIAR